MKKRGKILRDGYGGPGIVMIEGQQYPFSDEAWKSDVPPRLGLVVDVEFDELSRVSSVSAISDTQLLAELDSAAQTRSRKGSRELGALGLLTLVAIIVLVVSWLFLTTISVQLPAAGQMQYTFWQVLEVVHSHNLLLGMDHGSAGAGLYGMLTLLAMIAPLIPYFWTDRRAAIAGFLPLVVMLVVGLSLRALRGTASSSDESSVVAQMNGAAWKAMSLGWGAYLSLLAGICLAVSSTATLLTVHTPPPEQRHPPRSHRAAA